MLMAVMAAASVAPAAVVTAVTATTTAMAATAGSGSGAASAAPAVAPAATTAAGEASAAMAAALMPRREGRAFPRRAREAPLARRSRDGSLWGAGANPFLGARSRDLPAAGEGARLRRDPRL